MYKMMIMKRLRIFCLLLALLLMLSLSISPALTLAAEDSQFFAETGKTLKGKFLTYWKANGGLATYGYPITEARMEVDPETGQTFLTQWFERNRFELHPENAGTKYEVLLGLLGKDLRREALAVDPAFQPRQATDNPGGLYFPATSQAITLPLFAIYWQQNGGLERFGYPVSDAHDEVDPETGKVFRMQWFERARFELHPENPAPHNVLLGLLGKQLKLPTSKVEFVWKIAPQKSGFIFGKIALDSQDNIYVMGQYPADPFYPKGAQYIAKFDSHGRETQPRVGLGDIKGNESLGGLAVDSQGYIYVADTNEWGVEKFDPTGKSVARWTSEAGGDGVKRPAGITLDRQGNVYVGFGEYDKRADLTFFAIHKFDATGKFLARLQTTGHCCWSTSMGVDSQGNIYVVGGAGKIYKYDSQGRFLLDWSTWQSIGRDSGSATSLTVDFEDNIITLDNGLALASKYSNTGQLLQQWAGKGPADGKLDIPIDLVVNKQGEVYVSNLIHVPFASSKFQLVKFRQH